MAPRSLTVNDWLLDPSGAPGFDRFLEVDRVTASGHSNYTEYLYFHVPKRYALMNITSILEGTLKRSNIRDGLCFVSTMHITAGIYINDAEDGLLRDIAQWIEKLAPFGQDYRHHQTGEDNGDAHLKSYLTHPSLTLPVTRGHFDFGRWQQLFYAEFDGKREKRILAKISGIVNS